MKTPDFTSVVAADPILHLFLESVTDQAVFTMDTDGVITTWSEACVEMKGYSVEEAVGQHFSILYSGEDRARQLPEKNLEKALAKGQLHAEDIRIRKGGEPFVAEISIYPLMEGEVLKGYAKIVRDVSERRRQEDKREEEESSLRDSNEDLEGFCYSVAHDLKSPLRAIASLSRILKTDFGSHLPPAGQEYLERLVSNAMRLGSLVDALLNFARLGKSDLRRQHVDVSAMANRLAEEAISECEFAPDGVKVQAGMHSDVDPVMFEVVLRNLFENSCKYSDEPVHIQVGMEETKGEKVYRVTDEGIGFDMKHAAMIFEPFRRLNPHEKVEGSGIGLTNVKRVVERHGGRIWAESERGKGTTFYFTMASAA